MNIGKARAACCYDSISHSIYSFFGSGSDTQMIRDVEKFSIAENTWAPIMLPNILIG
jgi:hypothetical protein